MTDKKPMFVRVPMERALSFHLFKHFTCHCWPPRYARFQCRCGTCGGRIMELRIDFRILGEG